MGLLTVVQINLQRLEHSDKFILKESTGFMCPIRINQGRTVMPRLRSRLDPNNYLQNESLLFSLERNRETSNETEAPLLSSGSIEVQACPIVG